MDHGQHGGDIYRNEILYDFSININPLGMPKEVRWVLMDSIDSWESYPDGACEGLVRALAAYYQIPESWIVCGSGAADLIYQLVLARKPRKALVTAPAFSEYERALEAAGCRVIYENLKREELFAVNPQRLAERIDGDTELVFVCNPNNPTGMMVDGEAWLCLADACRKQHALLVIDECFCELSDRPETGSFLPFIGRYPEVLVLRAFTKTYALAGLRLGYGICSSREVLDGICRVRQPWSISTPAQQAGTAALGQREYLEEARAMIRRERERLKEGLESLGFFVYPSEANYLLFEDGCRKEIGNPDGCRKEIGNPDGCRKEIGNPAGCRGETGNPAGCRGETGNPDVFQGNCRNADSRREERARRTNLWEQLRERKILIRDCRNYRGLGEGFYRICIKRPAENTFLLEQLKDLNDIRKETDGKREGL